MNKIAILMIGFWTVYTGTPPKEYQLRASFPRPGQVGSLNIDHRGLDMMVLGEQREDISIVGLGCSEHVPRLIPIVPENELHFDLSDACRHRWSLTVRVPLRTDLKLGTNRGGNIRVRNVGGDHEVAVNRGDLEMSGISGSVVGTANRGNIDLELVEVADRAMSFIAYKGNITLHLPEDTKADIAVKIREGKVHSLLPLQPAGGHGPRLNRLNGGGKRISFTLNGGDLYLNPSPRK